MSRRRLALGREGEDLAADHLESQGYAIVERNWRCHYGEIDLVARGEDGLLVVEVRTRRDVRFGRPEESLDRRKQARLARLAQAYVQARKWPGPWRIELIAVQHPSEGPVQIRQFTVMG